MPTCSAINCSGKKRTHVSYFRFPKDKNCLQQWLENVGRAYLFDIHPVILQNNYRIGSLHFEDRCFANLKTRNRLNPNAVPTILTQTLKTSEFNLNEVCGIENGEDSDSEGPSFSERRRNEISNYIRSEHNYANHDPINVDDFQILETKEMESCNPPRTSSKSTQASPGTLNKEIQVKRLRTEREIRQENNLKTLRTQLRRKEKQLDTAKHLLEAEREIRQEKKIKYLRQQLKRKAKLLDKAKRKLAALGKNFGDMPKFP